MPSRGVRTRTEERGDFVAGLAGIFRKVWNSFHTFLSMLFPSLCHSFLRLFLQPLPNRLGIGAARGLLARGMLAFPLWYFCHSGLTWYTTPMDDTSIFCLIAATFGLLAIPAIVRRDRQASYARVIAGAVALAGALMTW